MARVAFTMLLREDKIEEYEREHAAVWPSVLKVIKDAGARNYSIYRSGTRVFGYYECDDVEQCRAEMAAGESALGWDVAMSKLVAPEVAENGEDYMTEVFRLD